MSLRVMMICDTCGIRMSRSTGEQHIELGWGTGGPIWFSSGNHYCPLCYLKILRERRGDGWDVHRELEAQYDKIREYSRVRFGEPDEPVPDSAPDPFARSLVRRSVPPDIFGGDQ